MNESSPAWYVVRRHGAYAVLDERAVCHAMVGRLPLEVVAGPVSVDHAQRIADVFVARSPDASGASAADRWYIVRFPDAIRLLQEDEVQHAMHTQGGFIVLAGALDRATARRIHAILDEPSASSSHPASSRHL